MSEGIPEPAFLAKTSLSLSLEKSIAGILEVMSPEADPFPASLNAQDQALFSLGYYHQRSEFFRKREATEEGEAAK